MQYQYNYSFLQDWMRVNQEVKIKAILQALGTKSNACLHTWIEGKSPMPVIGMLRFCNMFQVPISAFIINTGDPCQTEVLLPDNAKLAPLGGYAKDTLSRQAGERQPLDPTNVAPRMSRIPNGKPKATAQNIVPEAIESKKDAVHETISKSNFFELQQKHTDSLSEIIRQQRHLVEVIDKQQTLIGRQQAQIENLMSLLHEERNKRKTMGYGLVAEP